MTLLAAAAIALAGNAQEGDAPNTATTGTTRASTSTYRLATTLAPAILRVKDLYPWKSAWASNSCPTYMSDLVPAHGLALKAQTR